MLGEVRGGAEGGRGGGGGGRVPCSFGNKDAECLLVFLGGFLSFTISTPRELISARKTSHEYNDKDLSRLR